MGTARAMFFFMSCSVKDRDQGSGIKGPPTPVRFGAYLDCEGNGEITRKIKYFGFNDSREKGLDRNLGTPSVRWGSGGAAFRTFQVDKGVTSGLPVIQSEPLRSFILDVALSRKSWDSAKPGAPIRAYTFTCGGSSFLP